MRKFKKFLCAALASTMVFAMAAPSFAAQEAGKITITQTIRGQKYSVYQILRTKQNEAGTSFAYVATDEWKEFVESAAAAPYLHTDEADNVSWVASRDDATVAAFAQIALSYATNENTKIDATKEGTATGDSITFDVNDLGYFLVDSTAGTLVTLDTNASSVTINDKNEAPTVSKEVTSIVAANGVDHTSNTMSASIGDRINYTITINAKKGAQDYILHDTMDAGLTLADTNADNVVNENDITVTSIIFEPNKTYYTATAPAADGHAFDIVFNDDFEDAVAEYFKTNTADLPITITYSATLNGNAVVGESGNNNKAELKYGEGGETPETPDSEDKVYTFAMPIYKYTVNMEGDVEVGARTSLAGAVFTLSASNGQNATPIRISGENGVYKVAENQTQDVSDANTKMTTTDEGTINVSGLSTGTYYLTEVTAPSGYNKLKAPITVEITAREDKNENGDTVLAEHGMTQDGDNTSTISVRNLAGSMLPSTGGIGTTIFYAAGIILMAGAVFFVVRRKRA